MAHKQKTKNEEKQVAQAPEQKESNNAELAECQAQLSEWKEKFVQVSADLQNFRKRIEKDQLGWAAHAQAKVLTQLLSVIDNFDRAMAEKPESEHKDVSAWIDGIAMIHTAFGKMLAEFKVQPMDNYDSFDPHYHEALMQVDSDDHESGQIVDVLEKGYVMGDVVLRPAKVSVAQ